MTMTFDHEIASEEEALEAELDRLIASFEVLDWPARRASISKHGSANAASRSRLSQREDGATMSRAEKNRKAGRSEKEGLEESCSVAVGDVFVVPMRKGWSGAARLIEVATSRHPPYEQMYRFLVLDGFWRNSPSAQELEGCTLMERTFDRTGLRGQDHLKGWFSGDWPVEFEVVTRTRLTRFEREQGADASGTSVYQDARDFARNLFDHWRWRNDREALEAEWKRSSERLRAGERKRREGLSLAGMVRERPFHGWGKRWPKSVLADARRIFREATRALIDLEGTNRRAQRVALLSGIVTDFNLLDERSACIETSEREEIILRVEELASLVGLKNTRERLTGHRNW